MGALVKASRSYAKACLIARMGTNGPEKRPFVPPYRKSIISFARREKLLINCLYKFVKPRKTWILQWQAGSDHSAMVQTLSGFISTPSGVIINQTKLIHTILNSHFDNFR